MSIKCACAFRQVFNAAALMQLSIHKIYDIANLANPKTDYHPPSAVVAAAGSAGAVAAASADQSWLVLASADQSMATISVSGHARI